MRYSPSTGCFYPEIFSYNKLPNDIVIVAEDEAVQAQNAPCGSNITYKDGHILITPPAKILTLSDLT